MSEPRGFILGRSAWILRQLKKKIWVRASFFSLAAVVVALIAAFIDPYLPYDPQFTLAAGSVDRILDILAASMLAVTTFSLSIMVSAYSAATSNVTPRSTKLLLADSVAQNTLATFIGSFLFSIVSVVGLAAEIYTDKGRIVLFFGTIAVLVIIVATLLRWIEQLGKFGRVGDTIHRVEKAATPPLEAAGLRPCLGAKPAVAIPSVAHALFLRDIGPIVHIDVARLSEIAAKDRLTVHIAAMPGSLVHPRRPVLFIEPAADEGLCAELCGCVTIGKDREFEQDPRFGIIVLSEIASRALSPAVNDPGTAIEVVNAGLRALLAFADASDDRAPVKFQNVHAPDLNVDNLLHSFFNPIARDGGSVSEVLVRIVAALSALRARSPRLFAAATIRQGKFVGERAEAMLSADHDRKAVADELQDLLATES